MDIKENKKALYASIRKYRRTVKLLEDNLGNKIITDDKKNARYVSYEPIPTGTINCPLCHLYYSDWCSGCCICDDLGMRMCKGTPYHSYEDAVFRAKRITKQLVSATKKELKYLEGLYKRLGK